MPVDSVLYKRGAIAQVGCTKLPESDCSKHPACAWSPASKTRKTAGCVNTFVSASRSASAKMASGKNPFFAFMEVFRREHPELKGKEASVAGGVAYRAQKATAMVGGGCHIGAKGKCASYDGPDDEFCTLSPRSYKHPKSGKMTTRCMSAKRLKSQHNVKKESSPAQKAAAAKAREILAQQRRDAMVGGGCHIGAKGKCASYDGPDDEFCTLSPRSYKTKSGKMASKCLAVASAKRMYSPMRDPAKKSLKRQAAAAAAREVHAANVRERKMMNLGNFES